MILLIASLEKGGITLATGAARQRKPGDTQRAWRLVRNLGVQRIHQEAFQPRPTGGHLFWRDSTGHEVDLVYETPQGLQAVEIKSGSTWSSEWTEKLGEWQAISKESLHPIVVYGGDQNFERQGCQAVAWSSLGSVA